MKLYTLSLLLSFLTTFPLYSQANVVIYEVFAGGGNIGSYYKNDYVVLYNKGNVSQSLVGWSLQKAQNASSSNWKVFPLTGSIGANQYYLIKFDGNNNGSLNPLPTPDFDVTPLVGSGGITLLDVDLAVSAGKLALSSSTTAFNTSTPSGGNVVDFLGYGTADAAEGTKASAMDATHALRRIANGQDTNDNSVDFTRVSPNPINIALPVTLTYFRAVLEENKQVLLRWETASESNSSHFVVERSADALNYHEIANLPAQGNSLEVSQYTFTDVTPLAGVNYYRLRQVDMDDAFVTYRPVAVWTEESGTASGLYPNPMLGRVFFLKMENLAQASVMVFRVDGRMVDVTKIDMSPNISQLTINEVLDDGIYFVHIRSEEATLMRYKLVVKSF